MYQVTVDYAKANLEELCDRTEKESDGVAIVCENRSYILIWLQEILNNAIAINSYISKPLKKD